LLKAQPIARVSPVLPAAPTPHNLSKILSLQIENLPAPPATISQMRYFITFSCYGHFLHGQEPGTVDREHSKYGAPFAPASRRRLAYVRSLMKEPPFVLNGRCRDVVLGALLAACRKPGWTIWAAHVRATHVHVVIEADCRPEMVLRQLKASATTHLQAVEPSWTKTRRRHWARHGSTRYLWTEQQFRNAMSYVLLDQGEPQALFANPAWSMRLMPVAAPKSG